MASLDDMVSQLPIDQIAQALGVDEATASTAIGKAVPALVQGMQANATADPANAASLAKAIAEHAEQAVAGATADATAGTSGGATSMGMSDVNTADGEKIVGHVFGDNSDQVANQLGGAIGGGELFKKLLPMLAPLVMNFLAKNLGGGDDSVGGLLSKITSMLAGGTATTDPLAVELRDSFDPEGQKGFDYGMQLAATDTLPGPAKDKQGGLLPLEQRDGYRAAVRYETDRNRHATRAAAGAKIALTDPVLAAARTANPSPFSALGFDIAVAHFSPTAVGGEGSTATGPGSDKWLAELQDPLSKQGFSAAVDLCVTKGHQARKA